MISSRRASALGAARNHVPELGDPVTAHQARRNGPGELAASGGLLPLVAEQAAALQRGELDLGLSPHVGAQHRQVLARPQVRTEDHRLLSGRHGRHQILEPRLRRARPTRQPSSAASASARSGRASAQIPGP